MRGHILNALRNLIFFCPAVFLLFTACDDTICPSQAANKVKISFYDIQTRKSKYLSLDHIAALDTDSIFYDVDSLSTCSLPLNSLSDSTTYIFLRSPEADTLVVKYDRQFKLVSKDCGFSESMENIDSGFSTFPEVKPNTNVPRQPNDPDLEIYF